MTVLLMIGKVLLMIIKVLLILLLLALLFVLAVVFVPVRYSAEAVVKEEREVKARILWLFRSINVSISYVNNELKYRIKIFGIDYNTIRKFTGFIKDKLSFLKKRKKKDEEETKEDKKSEHKEERQNDIAVCDDEENDNFDNLGQNAAGEEKNNSSESEKYVSDDIDIEITDNDKIEDDTLGQDNVRKKFSIKRFFNLIIEKIKAILDGIKKIISFCTNGKKKLSVIIEFIKSDELLNMVCFTGDNVLHLLKKIKPKMLKGYVRFGTGDPCSTGEILGVIAVARGLCASDITVVPEFEEKVFECHVKVKGQIRIWTILIIAVKFIISDEWKQFDGLRKKMMSEIK